MKSTTKSSAGFTLVELLIVIAVIGILTSTVLSSINTARQKARIASVQASLKSVQTVGLVCIESGSDLNAATTSNLICDDATSTWPTLQTVGNWVYDTGCSFDGDVSDGTFILCAQGDGVTVTCTEERCTTG